MIQNIDLNDKLIDNVHFEESMSSISDIKRTAKSVPSGGCGYRNRTYNHRITSHKLVCVTEADRTLSLKKDDDGGAEMY